MSGCDYYPQDSSHTYERVASGTMIVGYLHNPPWVEADGPEPGGIMPNLVRELAKRLDARIVWKRGGEEAVLKALKEREIALVIGGITRGSSWSRHVAATRPYASTATVVAGPAEGLLEEIDGLPIKVPRGRRPVGGLRTRTACRSPRTKPARTSELRVAKAHELNPDEHVKMTLHRAKQAVAVPPGENRWLIEVDRFFNDKTMRVREELAAR